MNTIDTMPLPRPTTIKGARATIGMVWLAIT